jgi:ribosomal protein S1
LFEKDKKVKAVVIDFDKNKNHISLSTKLLIKNP